MTSLKEFTFKIFIGAVGTVIAYIFGGWTPLLKVLVFMVFADILTGILVSSIECKISSKIGWRGGVKKILTFFIVAVGHQIDMALGSESFFMNLAIIYYIANEGLSITENSAKAGLPVPAAIRKILAQLKENEEE